MLALTSRATANDELDAGPRKGGAGAERLCAVTRAVKPVDELIRFVVGPDGVVPDLKRKLPGRGLWITGEKAALKDAVTRNVFARGFKRELRVTPELVNRPNACWCALRSTLSRLQAKPDWSRPDLPRSRRPSPTTPLWA